MQWPRQQYCIGFSQHTLFWSPVCSFFQSTGCRVSASGKNVISKFEKDPRDIGNKAHTQRNIRELLTYLTNNGYNQRAYRLDLKEPKHVACT